MGDIYLEYKSQGLLQYIRRIRVFNTMYSGGGKKL